MTAPHAWRRPKQVEKSRQLSLGCWAKSLKAATTSPLFPERCWAGSLSKWRSLWLWRFWFSLLSWFGLVLGTLPSMVNEHLDTLLGGCFLERLGWNGGFLVLLLPAELGCSGKQTLLGRLDLWIHIFLFLLNVLVHRHPLIPMLWGFLCHASHLHKYSMALSLRQLFQTYWQLYVVNSIIGLKLIVLYLWNWPPCFQNLPISTWWWYCFLFFCTGRLGW